MKILSPFLILKIIIATTLFTILSFASSFTSASTFIVDVSGSAGDLAALRLLAATSGTQISLITVCGNCGTSPLAAWSRVRRFANWIGLRSVKVVLGSARSVYDKKQRDLSDMTTSSSSTAVQPTCRDNNGILAPTASAFSSFPVPSTGIPATGSETIVNDGLADWGSLFNTLDLDSWFGLDEEIASSTIPTGWTDSTMLPEEISSSTSATGTYITSARLSSPAVAAIRDFLLGSAVKVKFLILSSSMTNLAEYVMAERDINDLILADRNTANLQLTIQKIDEIHAKGGCFDSSACILKSLSGNSPKLSTSAKQKGEWNFAMDPDAADYLFSMNNNWVTYGSIPKYLYTDDMMYYGTLMESADWAKITTRLKDAANVFAAAGATGSARTTQFGGVELLVWLGKAFSAVESSWMGRASDFVLTSGSGFLNVFRVSEMFVALAVVDPTVRGSLEQQVDSQPKINFLLSGVDAGGVQNENATSRQYDSVYPTRTTNDVRVYTRGPSSTIPFWQSVSKYFFGFV